MKKPKDVNPIPVIVKDKHGKFACYFDQQRQLLFTVAISAEYAKEVLKWEWEEKE